MIIDINHPDALNINVYGLGGKKLGLVQSVDTDTMIGKQIVDFDWITGNHTIEDVDIYKIEGAGLYFVRVVRGKRVINTRKI